MPHWKTFWENDLSPESIASAQRKDKDCQHTITALKEGLPQPTFQLRQGLLSKRNIKR
jgi:hypothetical protein